MVFVSVCRALYDFTPEEADAKEQLAFAEGDILFITDKSGVDEEGQTSEESNDWWVAKHSETEASGDVPISYVEEVKKNIKIVILKKKKKKCNIIRIKKYNLQTLGIKILNKIFIIYIKYHKKKKIYNYINFYILMLL